MKSIILLLLTSLWLAGCVRTPTQEVKMVDDRPRVSFDTSVLEQNVGAYEVRVDGISFGSIEQYLQGKHTLPLLPGQHSIEVLLDNKPIFSKKVYLGENTSRVIKVVHYD